MPPQGETSDSVLGRLAIPEFTGHRHSYAPTPGASGPQGQGFRRSAGLGSKEHDEGSAPMTDRPIRASDKERESVVDVLRDAYTDGRLTLEEFDERTSAAYASKTWADLRELTADLPVEPVLGADLPQRHLRSPPRSRWCRRCPGHVMAGVTGRWAGCCRSSSSGSCSRRQPDRRTPRPRSRSCSSACWRAG